MIAFFNLIALGSAIATAYIAARGALSWCNEGSKPLAIALALAWLAAVPAQLCRWSLSLTTGLVVSAALTSVIAWALRRIARPETVDPRPSPASFAAMAGVFLLIASTTVRGNFFDETIHWPAALTTLRGIVPLEIPVFPGVVQPYHWAVDALYAQLVLVGFTVQQAVDTVTLICAALLLALAWVLGARFTGGSKGATLTALVVPFAGSALAWPLYRLGDLSLQSPYPAAWSDPLTLPQPLIAVFFQHPQGLAMPLFIAVLLLFCRDLTTTARVIGAVLLALVSLANTVAFAGLGLGLACGAVYRAITQRSLRVLAIEGATLLGALAGALLLGGMIGHGPTPVPGTFFPGSLAMRLMHHLVIFGLPLVMVLFCMRQLGFIGVVLASIATTFYVIPNFVVLPYTWDIVKLYDIAQYAAGISLALVLGREFQLGRHRALVLAAALLTTATPAAWLVANATAPRLGLGVTRELVMDRGLEQLRIEFSDDIPARARVLTDDPRLGTHTGFFTPGFTIIGVFNFHGHYGMDAATVASAQRHWALALEHLRRDDLDALKIDYLIVTQTSVARLSDEGHRALGDASRFAAVDRLGDVVLFRVLR